MAENQSPFVVAITGASGSVYGIRLIEVLAELGERIDLIISESASTVIREERGIELGDLKGPRLERLFNPETLARVSYYNHGDFTAPAASGSYPTRGMLIVPCSTATLARVAHGISQTLIERAAECMIKEGRPLILVPRETPLSAIHLENMLKLARLGVRIVPAMPAFYSGPASMEDMIDFVVGKALDQIGISHGLFKRWVGSSEARELLPRDE